MLLVAIMSLATALAASAAGAKENWDTMCAKCHGADGKGQTNIGRRLGVKDYTDPQVQAALKDEAVVKAIKEGLKDKEGKIWMKPTAGLPEAEVNGLVAYMRTFKN